MKTTQLITASITLILGFAAPALAGPSGGLHQVVLTAMSLGDNDSTNVDELLKRARQAIDEANWETAESCLARAEAQHPTYNMFHVGDTPKKVRADLDKKRAAKQAGPKPSSFFSPTATKKSDGSTVENNPFAARPTAAAAVAQTSPSFEAPALAAPASGKLPWSQTTETPGGRALTSQPPTEFGPDVKLPSKGEETPAAADPDAKTKSDELLHTARKALAVGDIRRAAQMLEQAKACKAPYSLGDNEPNKVESLIRRQNELLQSKAGRETTDVYKRQYSDLLLEQANGMAKLGDLEEAERLANDAQRLGVKYTAFDTRPSMVLDNINLARGGTKAGTTAIAGGLNAAAGSLNNAVNSASNAVNSANNAAQDFASKPFPAMPAGFGMMPPVATTVDTKDINSVANAKQEIQRLLTEARAAIAKGDLPRAEQLVSQTEAWKLSDTLYVAGEDRPGFVRLEIEKARAKTTSIMPKVGAYPVTQASNAQPADFNATWNGGKPTVTQAAYDPAQDRTRNVQVTGDEPSSSRFNSPVIQAVQATLPQPPEVLPSPETSAGTGNGIKLYKQAEEALQKGNSEEALKLFREAYAYRNELDPGRQQALQDKLQLMSGQAISSGKRGTPGESLLPAATANEQLLNKKYSADVARRTADAKTLREHGNPKGAMESLTKLRSDVEKSELEARAKEALTRRVDGEIRDLSKFIDGNKAQIELDQTNKDIKGEIAREQKVKIEVQEKLAKLVNEFNQCMHEQRYAEAEVIAKKCNELDPRNPTVVQVMLTAKFAHRLKQSKDTEAEKEQGWVDVMEGVNRTGIPTDKDFQFGDPKYWQQLTDSRGKRFKDEGKTRQSPKDMEIRQRLMTPVSFKFHERPLEEVVKYIGQMAQINVYFDPQGLSAENASTSDLISIDLQNEISVKSALDLILPSKHLSWVIKHETLTITSEHMRDNNVTTVNYSVADLVIPIPNFVPNGNMGLAAAIREGYNRAGTHNIPGSFTGIGGPVAVVAANENGSKMSAILNPEVKAQMAKAGFNPTGSSSGNGSSGKTLGQGPGGLGGGSQADFDSLIELITSTVRPPSWDTVGGPGSVKGFEGTLSLVVSQTQEVHEEIADLLKQLRRLQDLQVTIEVRFISLSDQFFERIGFDFEFDLKDKSGFGNSAPNNAARGTIIGLQGANTGLGATPSANQSAFNNIAFRQGSFGETSTSPVTAAAFSTSPASFGFAILSDIEAYFLVQAAQGDSRSNILQAPKVTLFNGQQAFVSDTTQRPFVISVVPVVGDFAAAQQPVIVVLSEGTSLTVQAVVTSDRRFVRLTVVPFFSQIGDVQEFTFEGTSSTKNDSSSTAKNDATTTPGTTSSATTTRSGTTVQLPVFSFVTVTTTVSVPDGGTVLLGGIKRLQEGRNERGVPLLSKLPYVNRLFKNVAIARSTTSLMMMVTPRIIIQEEEESRLLGNSQTQ